MVAGAKPLCTHCDRIVQRSQEKIDGKKKYVGQLADFEVVYPKYMTSVFLCRHHVGDWLRYCATVGDIINAKLRRVR